MKTQIKTADLEVHPGQLDRSAGDILLDVGASFDWITPGYALVRNVLHEGENVNIDAEVWRTVRPQLQEREIPFWGEQLWHDDGGAWMTVSLPAAHIQDLNELLAGANAGAVQPQGRLWQWLGVLLLVLLAGSVLIMVAAVGGAL